MNKTSNFLQFLFVVFFSLPFILSVVDGKIITARIREISI